MLQPWRSAMLHVWRSLGMSLATTADNSRLCKERALQSPAILRPAVSTLSRPNSLSCTSASRRAVKTACEHRWSCSPGSFVIGRRVARSMMPGVRLTLPAWPVPAKLGLNLSAAQLSQVLPPTVISLHGRLPVACRVPSVLARHGYLGAPHSSNSPCAAKG